MIDGSGLEKPPAPGGVVGFLRGLAWLVLILFGLGVAGLFYFSFQFDAGLDDEDMFTHYFSTQYNGERVLKDDTNLRVTASERDFPFDFESKVRNTKSTDGRAPIGFIVPDLVVGVDGIELDDDGRLCLQDPILIFEASTDEQVAEVPAGTCLEPDGKTLIFITSR